MLMCLAFPFIDISTKLIDNELCHSTERLKKKNKQQHAIHTQRERGSTPRYRCRRWRCLSVCSHCFHVCECYSVATHNDSHTQNLVQLAFSFLPVRRVHLQVSSASSSSNSKPGKTYNRYVTAACHCWNIEAIKLYFETIPHLPHTI